MTDDEDLLELVQGLSFEDLSDLVESLPLPAAEALLSVAGAATPVQERSPLRQAQALDPKYRSRPHLQYLSERLTAAVQDVQDGENRRLTISMPPRMGKSVLTSLYLPLWLQRVHPSWKVGILSHDDSLVTGWSSAIRKLIEDRPDLGVTMERDHGASSQWALTEGGGLVARSIGSSVTGLGFKVLLLDDVVKDFVTAHSARMRDLIWEKWRSDIFTRLEPPYLVIAIGCLTAETPVLMADGTERPIAEVRPGDHVMTYEDGRISTSVVTNWAPQGEDIIYRVTTASGRVVRGNAKHPFRVLTEEGAEEWRRLDSLKPGDLILSAEETRAPRTTLCAGCSAMTATSSSSTEPRSSVFSLPWTTYEPGLDRVTSLVIEGYETVYDIEVARTHNFIANGLQVSNTRWHEDDFIGRLLSPEREGDPDEWERIEFPAIAEQDDVLGRSPGQPLFSPLQEETEEEALARWDEVRSTVGTYTWSGLYQQHPSPAKGAIFEDEWWRYWTLDPERADGERVFLVTSEDLQGGEWVDSWDMSFKSSETSDFTVGQRWVRVGPFRYLIHQARGRWSFTRSLEELKRWARTDDGFASPYGRYVHVRLVEEAANGAAVIDVMRKEISGIKPIRPRDSKESRARAITPEVESGHVLLPYPGEPGNEWVADLLSELRNFPHDTHDDQVDTLTQALNHLRGAGGGGVSVPGRMGASIKRNPARASQTSIRRSPATAATGLRRLR